MRVQYIAHIKNAPTILILTQLDFNQKTNVTVNGTDPVVVISPNGAISFVISFQKIQGN